VVTGAVWVLEHVSVLAVVHRKKMVEMTEEVE
jgi:hypothetical protein